MKLATAARWSLYLLSAFAVGVLAGVFGSGSPLSLHPTNPKLLARPLPIVLDTDQDYHTDNGVVGAFDRWATGPLGQRVRGAYPPNRITAETQQEMASRLMTEAVQQGEMENVVSACALHAITRANSEEATDARSTGESHPHAHTVLAYAEHASYFGQDAWCFLGISSADQRHATLRVLVMSSVPDFGLVHQEAFR